MYILSISLLVLFIFDGSAFSAGSLISVIFWISSTTAGSMKLEIEAIVHKHPGIFTPEDGPGEGNWGKPREGRREQKLGGEAD
jgi:hypothetical protein